MREFSADYLRRTREGMWGDSQDALEALALESRNRVLDVGCGTGELTRVLAAHCPSEVVGCDVDTTLLQTAQSHGTSPVVTGDALRLPFPDDTFDLVVCQALLINLPDPAVALEEFARVSSDRVAAIEPDNSEVRVDSSVNTEQPLERRARQAYLEGVETDVTLGGDARDVFETAGIDVIDTKTYDHEQTIEVPYDEHALAAARRKATGAGLADDRATMLASGLSLEAYDELRREWREMGRTVISQMQDQEYRRREVVPFHVTVGRVPDQV